MHGLAEPSLSCTGLANNRGENRSHSLLGSWRGFGLHGRADGGRRRPTSRVDTIEFDPAHADIAEAELGKRGLSNRVRILRGDAKDILQALDEPYDVVFSDGGQNDISHELRRLTRRAGAGDEIKARLREPLIGVLADLRASLANQEAREADALSRARVAYRRAVRDVLS